MGSDPLCLKEVTAMDACVRINLISYPAQSHVEHPGHRPDACGGARWIDAFIGMSFIDKGAPAFSKGGW